MVFSAFSNSFEAAGVAEFAERACSNDADAIGFVVSQCVAKGAATSSSFFQFAEFRGSIGAIGDFRSIFQLIEPFLSCLS